MLDQFTLAERHHREEEVVDSGTPETVPGLVRATIGPAPPTKAATRRPTLPRLSPW